MMDFKKLLLAATALLGTIASCVSSDWTTQKWDMIIVGAGPAGIIGEF